MPRSRRLALYAGFVVATAILTGLLDPAFGFDAASATLVIGVVIGLPVLTLVSSAGSRLYTKVRHKDRALMRVLPGSLLIAALCVLVSRLAHFAPGYMYGVIAGFVFSRELSNQEEGRRAATGAALMLVASVAVLVVLSGLQGHTPRGLAGYAYEVLLASLTSVFLGGIQGLTIGLIPLRSLPGQKVFAWSKTVWAVLIGATFFLFVHLLLHPQNGFGAANHPTPLFTWLALFVVFGLVSVLFWAYFRYRPTRPNREPAIVYADA